jgi:hypothetical protein
MKLKPDGVDAERPRVSHLFATLGPLSSSTARMYGQDRVAAIRAEHRAWRDEHLAAWERGEAGVPDPPYADVLDHYARPG